MASEATRKTHAALLVDERLLRQAERVAQARRTTLDQLVGAALRREVQAPGGAGHRRPPGTIRLPTHGHGGLLAGVELADKELLDRLLGEP